MLTISAAHLDSLRRHARETYPRECCGILLGRRAGDSRTVAEIVACANVAQAPSAVRRYSIAPEDLIRTQRAARARGLEIVGFYHSHPDHPARWSPDDLAEAYWPACSYVIIAVNRGRAAETQSFVLRGTDAGRHFESELLRVGSDRAERPGDK